MYDQNNLTGGLQYVPQIAVQQVIYLDFDGESTSYDGEILSIDGVEMAPSQLTAERIAGITAKLNERYASQGISFVTERPLSSTYSTIFVGKTAAFDRYGSFAGLAETIDKGNLNSSDKAFVLLEAADTDETIIATISHETDHLTGTLDHGGEGLAAYAATIVASPGILGSGMLITSGDLLKVPDEAKVNFTTLSNGSMSILSGGVASNTSVSNGGVLHVSSGGTARYTTVSFGEMYIFVTGFAERTTLNNGGTLFITSAGSANNITVNNGGTLFIDDRGTATTIKVSAGGMLFVSSGGTATNVTWTPCEGLVSAADGATVIYNSAYKGVYYGSNNKLLSQGFEFSNDTISSGVLSGGVMNGGSMYVFISGTADDIKVQNKGSMHIFSGGTASRTTITSGVVHVYSGGSADAATVNGAGELAVHSSGVANKPVINNSGRVTIHSAGLINEATVSSGGRLDVCDGGTADNTKVAVLGRLYINSGGVANSTIVSGGLYTSGWTYSGAASMYISSGGIANNIITYSSSYVFLSAGASAKEVTVNNSGNLQVDSDGIVENLRVNGGGTVHVSAGGSALNVIWTPCEGVFDPAHGAYVTYASQYCGIYYGSGNRLISSGASFNGVTINGITYVMAGGYASNTTVNNRGSMHLWSGGRAENTTVNAGGSMLVSSGASAAKTTVYSAGSQDVLPGAVVDSTTIEPGGVMHISSGGIATNVKWSPGVGSVHIDVGAHVTFVSQYLGVYCANTNSIVSSAILMNDKEINYSDSMYIMAGGTANATVVYSSGKMFIWSGGTANETVVGRYRNGNYYYFAAGQLCISSGGVASKTSIFRGSVDIYSGGKTVSTTVYSDGRLNVFSGGLAETTTVDGDGDSSRGELCVSSGGRAVDTKVVDGGTMHILSGGFADQTTVVGILNTSAILEISAGGFASRTTVKTNAFLNVSSGASATDVIINSGGFLIASAGATLAGTIDLAGKLHLDSAYSLNIDSNTHVKLRVDQRTVHDEALIEDLRGDIAKATFSITVKDDQQTGTYRLADHAAAFRGTITVSNDSGALLGVFTQTDTAFNSGYYQYALVKTGEALNLTITALPPPSPTVTADVMALTKGNVILTADFSAVSTSGEYRINGGTWQVYTEAVSITQNCKVEFRGCDSKGTYSNITSYLVNNIDKEAPVLTVTANTLAPAEQVTLSATVNEDCSIMYSSNNVNWQEYSESFTVLFNGTWYFKAQDAAGNETIQKITVSNIRRTSPIVTVDVTDAPSKSVTLTVFFTPSAAEKQYSFDNEHWIACEKDTLVINENGTVYFRDIDSSGNVSEVAEYTVSNIDNAAPDIPKSMEFTVAGSTLTVDWADVEDHGIAGLTGYNFRYGTEESLSGNGEFLTSSTAEVTGLDHGTWYFQVQSVDAAGNVSEWSNTFSTVVDLKAPEISLSANTRTPVNSTWLTASVNDGSPIWYSTDGESWNTYTESIKVTENGTWYFKATDDFGNTAEKSITFTNIDSSLPDGIIVTADITTPTRQFVTLTVQYSEQAVQKQYSLDGIKWRSCPATLKLRSNTTLYFREIDGEGNISDVITYTVSNIDQAAPDAPDTVEFTASGDTLTVDWNDAADNGTAGIAGYNFRYGTSEILTGEGEFVDVSIVDAAGLEAGTWYFQFQSVDAAGNVSAWSEVCSHTVSAVVPGISNLTGSAEGLSWEDSANSASYVVEYSTDGFETAVTLMTDTCAVDAYALPAGTFQWRVRAAESSQWFYGEEITAAEREDASVLTSDADGDKDVFFGNARGVWEANYAAQHLGSASWEGTGEELLLRGKNKIEDIFTGSDDANTLVLTDDANGDALFVDDIYSSLGDQARFSRISKILAGAGNDVVDMTSQRYSYSGTSITICGGDGNDTLWGGAETNTLFGDAGNDRLVGASGNDVLAGGAGDDSMHGGGGDDIFTFGADWGKDTVEQLETGSVTLWFAEGDESSWDSETMTYSDGVNSVTVTGCADVTLKFGASADLPAGAFEGESSRKVFEDKAMLA